MGEDIKDDKKAAALFDTEQLKSVMLVIPLIGGIIAIAYDVGYFYGVDINYFTVFSLAEHLVFALETAPFSIIMAFCLVALWTIRSQRQESKGSSARRQIIGYLPLLVVSLLLWWVTSEAIVFAPLLLLLIEKTISTRDAGAMKRLSISVISTLFVICLGGYLIGGTYVKGNIPTHILNDDARGRLIRAGERGILFAINEPKQVAFFKWDGIKSIKTLELSESDRRAIKWLGR
jgi:hypothetical protein